MIKTPFLYWRENEHRLNTVRWRKNRFHSFLMWKLWSSQSETHADRAINAVHILLHISIKSVCVCVCSVWIRSDGAIKYASYVENMKKLKVKARIAYRSGKTHTHARKSNTRQWSNMASVLYYTSILHSAVSIGNRFDHIRQIWCNFDWNRFGWMQFACQCHDIISLK